jgi:hypothetical protein
MLQPCCSLTLLSNTEGLEQCCTKADHADVAISCLCSGVVLAALLQGRAAEVRVHANLLATTAQNMKITLNPMIRKHFNNTLELSNKRFQINRFMTTKWSVML